MLVLSRYPDETVHIGEDCIVSVLKVSGDKIKLGFEAPDDVPIMRTEIQEAIRSGELERKNHRLPAHIVVVTEQCDYQQALYIDGRYVQGASTIYATDIELHAKGRPVVVSTIQVEEIEGEHWPKLLTEIPNAKE